MKYQRRSASMSGATVRLLCSLMCVGLALLTYVVGCSNSGTPRAGSARIGVSGQALALGDIARVEVTVTGDHIDPDIVAELTLNGSTWEGVIQSIPAGEDRTFEAAAYDAGDAVIYQGSASGVTIADGETAVVHIYLQQVEPAVPFENAVPRFTSLVASANQIAPGHLVNLSVAATDPNVGDTLTYEWTATGGAFDDAAATDVAWTAPATPGFYQLTVSVADPTGATATISFSIDVQVHYGSGSASVSLDINTWPVVEGLVPDPTRIDVGESTVLDLTASDPDEDVLTFAWTADCDGSFDDDTAEDPTFTLNGDNAGVDCTLMVDITDGRGGSNTASVAVATGPGVTASVGGGSVAEGPSCAGGLDCNGESCCTSIVLPVGSYLMGRGTEMCSGCVDGCPSGMTCYDREQPEHPATVSSYRLDKFEVTVGRFRAFVEAYDGTPPPAGAGVHPLIAGSGWDSTWNSALPTDRAQLEDWISSCSNSYTWTPSAGANEQYPINCVSWYEAFAFCIWDGGRLPTEAEQEFAAAGGDENRVFPWGDDVTEPLPANYSATDLSPFVAVGSYPTGNGRWDHADLAGSMYEWTLDWYASDWYTTTQAGCSDCANLTGGSGRAARGGGWSSSAVNLRAVTRMGSPLSHYTTLGVRCAGSAP